jgi:hypothetical protein
MLDLFGIVFSSVMIWIALWRALQLDSADPWFEIRRPEPPGPGQGKGGAPLPHGPPASSRR